MPAIRGLRSYPLNLIRVMPVEEAALIRPATLADDDLIASHFLRMWTDSPTTAGAVVPDGRDRVLAFVAEGRKRLAFAAFIAEVDGAPVGSASCQLHLTPYPNVLEPGYRRYGYIWGVYVEPDWRRRGLARQLTEATLTYLRDLACTRVILNASPSGRPVYESMGFQPSNEMRLNLQKVG